MEFVKFNCENKVIKNINNINVNKFYYYTNKIVNENKYLLIKINDTNIDFVKIIVNNKIRYINGNISRSIVEIKPYEEYHYEIFDKQDELYINKIDFLDSYVLISYFKN